MIITIMYLVLPLNGFGLKGPMCFLLQNKKPIHINGYKKSKDGKLPKHKQMMFN